MTKGNNMASKGLTRPMTYDLTLSWSKFGLQCTECVQCVEDSV